MRFISINTVFLGRILYCSYPKGTCRSKFVPWLIWDPLLIDVLIEPWQYPHHLPAASVHHDVAPHSIMDINALCLPQLPGSSGEGIGLGCQCSNWTQVWTEMSKKNGKDCARGIRVVSTINPWWLWFMYKYNARAHCPNSKGYSPPLAYSGIARWSFCYPCECSTLLHKLDDTYICTYGCMVLVHQSGIIFAEKLT